MKLTFLSAAIPLTKTIAFSQRDNTYTVAPYPMISRVSSHEYEANDLRDFERLLREQGALGRCLMFGQLDKTLQHESRAGHAVVTDHEWVCFDFDKVDCPPTMDGAITAIGKYLPPACKHVDAIIQLSPSCFHPLATKLSAHVFMRLDPAQPASTLKDFIVWANFNSALKDEIKLTDSGNALSFALDRCVTDASRLLYIAPPKCVGFKPSLSPDKAIQFVRGTARALSLPKFSPIDRSTINDKINALRKENMLEERTFRTIEVRGFDVLMEPGACVIHDVRSSGDGFIRFNINGGDSLAYFINLKEPQFIGNFKGEPYMYTREANEQFFKALTKAIQAMPSQSRASPTTDVLAFYATNRGSSVYIGTYDRATDTLRVDKSTETASSAWLKQFGIPVTTSLPHYDLSYDVTSDVRYEEGFPVINLFERTDFMKQFGNSERIMPLGKLAAHLEATCPVIYKTLKSITGNDERSLLGFVNWLAFIFQNRTKTGTAWLLWGTEGTGKGMFLEHVAKPIFGVASTTQMLMNNVDSDFNSILEGKLLVNIDEAAMSRTRDKVEAMSKIKNWITEPYMVINEKHRVEQSVPSFVNFIFTSNDTRPLHIAEGDRRIHVAPRQERRLHYGPNEAAVLLQGEELPAFAQVLGELKVDEFWVRNPDASPQKSQLFESSHSLLDRVAQAIREGDTDFFFEARPPAVAMATDMSNAMLPLAEYDRLLTAMADGTLDLLRREDLYVLFHVVINDPKMFSKNPSEQKRIFNRYRLLPTPGSKASYSKWLKKTAYGYRVTTPFKKPSLENQDVLPQADSANVTSIDTPRSKRSKS